MYTIIPLILIITSLGIILVIIARHAPKAAALDVSTLPEEREAQLKSSILENRLLRKIDSIFKISTHILAPLTRNFTRWYEQGKTRMRSLERAYRFQGGLPDSEKKSAKKAQATAREAQENFAQSNFTKAETLYLSAIKMDPLSAESYMGLGTTYAKMNEWEQARETFEYVTKTWPQNDEAFAALAMVEENQGNTDEAKDHFLHALSINNEVIDYHLGLAELYLAKDDKEKAFSSLQKAQVLEPNNPKVLDRLLQVSILVGNKEIASEVLEKIKKSNPDHGKISEFEKTIKELK